MTSWHLTDEALHEMIDDEILMWVLEGRLDEPAEPWDEMDDG